MYKFILITGLILISSIQIMAQVNSYSRANNYSYLKPSSTNLDLEYMVLCRKQLNYDISVAHEYATFCGDNMSLCFIEGVDLSHSSWIERVLSFFYNGTGYSMLSLKNGKFYYFHYIPLRVLYAWEESDSPGLFYHTYIKDNYTLSQCIDYTP